MQDAKNKKWFVSAAVIAAVVVSAFVGSSFAEPNSSLENPRLEAETVAGFKADDSECKTVFLGVADPNTEDPDKGFRFRLELNSKGAAIARESNVSTKSWMRKSGSLRNFLNTLSLFFFSISIRNIREGIFTLSGLGRSR